MQQLSSKAALLQSVYETMLSENAWSRILTHYCVNLCTDDPNQHSEKAIEVPTELWKDLEQASKPRAYVLPTCQVSHTVTTCGLPVCWPSITFPLWYQQTADLSTCLWLRGKRFQRAAFLPFEAREHRKVPRDGLSVDLQLIFAYWLFLT